MHASRKPHPHNPQQEQSRTTSMQPSITGDPPADPPASMFFNEMASDNNIGLLDQIECNDLFEGIDEEGGGKDGSQADPATKVQPPHGSRPATEMKELATMSLYSFLYEAELYPHEAVSAPHEDSNNKATTRCTSTSDREVAQENKKNHANSDKRKNSSRSYTLSSFMLFHREYKEQAKKALLQESQSLKLRAIDVSKRVVELWKSLPEEQRDIWREKANKLRRDRQEPASREVQHNDANDEKIQAPPREKNVQERYFCDDTSNSGAECYSADENQLMRTSPTIVVEHDQDAMVHCEDGASMASHLDTGSLEDWSDADTVIDDHFSGNQDNSYLCFQADVPGNGTALLDNAAQGTEVAPIQLAALPVKGDHDKIEDDDEEQEEEMAKVKQPVKGDWTKLVVRSVRANELFCKHHRQAVKDKNPKLSFKNVSDILSTMWKDITELERKKFQCMAVKQTDAKKALRFLQLQQQQPVEEKVSKVAKQRKDRKNRPTDVATLQQQLVTNDGEGADEASPRTKVKVVNDGNVGECAVSKEEQRKEVVGAQRDAESTDSLALVQDQKREGKYFEFVFESEEPMIFTSAPPSSASLVFNREGAQFPCNPSPSTSSLLLTPIPRNCTNDIDMFSPSLLDGPSPSVQVLTHVSPTTKDKADSLGIYENAHFGLPKTTTPVHALNSAATTASPAHFIAPFIMDSAKQRASTPFLVDDSSSPLNEDGTNQTYHTDHGLKNDTLYFPLLLDNFSPITTNNSSSRRKHGIYRSAECVFHSAMSIGDLKGAFRNGNLAQSHVPATKTSPLSGHC